jgi:signal transduction histidine kinase
VTNVRPLVLVGTAAVAGAAVTLAAGAAAGMPSRDLGRLLPLLLPGAAAGLSGAAVVPRLLAGASLRGRFVAVAVVGVAVAAVSLAAVVTGMFASGHDVLLAAVVLAYAGATGVATAAAVGRMSVAAVGRLAGTAGALGEGDLDARVGPLQADRELMELGRVLDDMASRLQASIAREREVEARRRDLMTAVSHDLRTPLAGLRAMVEAIDEGVVADAPTLRRYMAEMRRAVDSLTRLVDDLFELAQVDAGAIERETQRVRLEDVVRSAVAEVEGQAKEKGLAVETALEGAGDVMISPRLLRVLQNLLHNAVRHTPADGTVRVEAAREPGGLRLAVEDNGEGIAPQALPHVFEPFWQGDPARSGNGSGLGLALAKRIVEALGGRIEVRSEPTRGARFAVWIPERA